MKKFTFRLERVIEVRNVKKKECQKALAKSLEELSREEQELHSAVSRSQAGSEGLRRALQSPARAGDLAGLEDWRRRQEEAVQTQARRTEERRLEVDRRRGALVLAARDEKVLEQLKERRREEFQADCRREEQAFLDEVAGRAGRTAKCSAMDDTVEER
ncbi:MAG: flagellar export protein FliJ [Candidatus Zixiibacteriota bacterium]|nr:MAG: flagellar export protein FliJ [candidate division Zixibacteria bacterium]